MYKIIAILFCVIFQYVSIAGQVNLPEFKVNGLDSVQGSYMTVYTVTGRDVFGQGITIGAVYSIWKSVKIESDFVELPASRFNYAGWRGPTHIVMVIHHQKKHALNVYNSPLRDGSPLLFEAVEYINGQDLVEATGESMRYIYRRSLEIDDLDKVIYNFFE